MRVLLATGIYPPDIGGPATYVQNLARELTDRGISVTVITYVHRNFQIPHSTFQTNSTFQNSKDKESWPVVNVPKRGGPLLRWMRYAKALREHVSDADMIIAFSSVSAGVPLMLAHLKKPRTRHLVSVQGKPRKILRLGGDFFWERYTDRGGQKSLREYYEHPPWSYQFTGKLIGWILREFDCIVFSTRMQEEVYEKHYRELPQHSVIENAIPEGSPKLHDKHEPFRLLFLGRLVGFKNLSALVRSVAIIRESPLRRNVTLTLVGDGPMKEHLETLTRSLKLQGWVRFLPATHGEEKNRYFADYDLLMLPSLTEISPNVALEARAAGLPVLLSEETGFSELLRTGMIVRLLRTEDQIVQALLEVLAKYLKVAASAATPAPRRSWGDIAEEFLEVSRKFS